MCPSIGANHGVAMPPRKYHPVVFCLPENIFATPKISLPPQRKNRYFTVFDAQFRNFSERLLYFEQLVDENSMKRGKMYREKSCKKWRLHQKINVSGLPLIVTFFVIFYRNMLLLRVTFYFIFDNFGFGFSFNFMWVVPPKVIFSYE